MQQDIRTLKQKCNAAMIALCPCQVWWSSVKAQCQYCCDRLTYLLKHKYDLHRPLATPCLFHSILFEFLTAVMLTIVEKTKQHLPLPSLECHLCRFPRSKQHQQACLRNSTRRVALDMRGNDYCCPYSHPFPIPMLFPFPVQYLIPISIFPTYLFPFPPMPIPIASNNYI